MAEGTLSSNKTGTFDFYQQNNDITLETENTFVDADIALTINVKKAVLTTDTATNVFDIQVPNGDSTVTFNFSVDADGNVLVT